VPVFPLPPPRTPAIDAPLPLGDPAPVVWMAKWKRDRTWPQPQLPIGPPWHPSFADDRTRARRRLLALLRDDGTGPGI
jgi:hypothetical protein